MARDLFQEAGIQVPLPQQGPRDLLAEAGVAPQIENPWLRYPAMVASNAAKGASSLAGIPGDIETGLQHAFDATVGKGMDQFMPKLTPAQQQQLAQIRAHSVIPTSAGINAAGQNAGLFDRSDLAAQNPFEHYLQSAAQGAGAAIPFALGGGPLALAKAGISGTTAGLGSQGAQDLFPQHPAIASLVGALGGGYAGGKAFDAASKIGNMLAGVTSPTMQAYQEAGVTPRLAGDVTENPTLQRLQAYAAKAPFGHAVNEAAKQTVDEFGNAANRTADQLGQSQTLQEAGEALQGESKKWLQNFRNDSAANWGQVDQFIPPQTAVPVTKYSKALSDIGDTLSSAPKTADILQSGMSRNLLEALKADAPGGELPWDAVKNIRTRIGEMLSEPNLPSDTSMTELKRLYKGLSGDMESAATAQGPNAEAAFQYAAQSTKQGHAFVDNILRPFLKEGAKPETVAKSVLSSADRGGSLIGPIRQEMPAAADELAAYKLRDMAASNSGAQNAAGTQSSPGSFLSDLNKLSDEGHAALFSDPQVQAKIDALSKISEGIKNTSKLVNTSNTATHQGTGALLRDIFLGGSGGYAVGGLHGAITGAAAGAALPFTGKIASGLTATPWLTRLMATPSAATPLTTPMLAGATYGALSPDARAYLMGQGQ